MRFASGVRGGGAGVPVALCLVLLGLMSGVLCQYEDSFEEGGSSEPQVQDSSSQEVNGGEETGAENSDEPSQDNDITPVRYNGRLSAGDTGDDTSETIPATTTVTVEAASSQDPQENRFNRFPSEEGDMSKHVQVPLSGDPYILYQNSYSPYSGHAFDDLTGRILPSLGRLGFYPPSVSGSYPSSRFHWTPASRTAWYDHGPPLTHSFTNDQPMLGRAGPPPDNSEDLPGENQIPPGENFDYLRRLRNIVIMSRLRKQFGHQAVFPVFGPSHTDTAPFHLYRDVPSLSEHFKPNSPQTTTRNLTQLMAEEMDTLRGRLHAMEVERVKLRTILMQLKGILNEMHKQSLTDTPLSSWLNPLNRREIRIARLRNLFIILNGITRLTPLTPDEIEQINYEVGLFDPKITDASKAALISRMILWRRTHSDLETDPSPSHIDSNDVSARGGMKATNTQSGNDDQARFGSSVSSPSSSDANESADRRGVLQCKLRRLRNLYLLVRPFVTGIKLTREELREIFQSHEGFFEPGLSEAQKIALVSKMAETIRLAHFSRQLVLGTTKSSSSSSASSEDSATRNDVPSMSSTAAPRPIAPQPPAMAANSETSSSPSPPPFVRSPLLIITRRFGKAPPTPAPPSSDKMHVSGKIQMDLNIEGDIDASQQNVLSRIL